MDEGGVPPERISRWFQESRVISAGYEVIKEVITRAQGVWFPHKYENTHGCLFSERFPVSPTLPSIDIGILSDLLITFSSNEGIVF